jgi:hypothetical protein
MMVIKIDKIFSHLHTELRNNYVSLPNMFV